jgi:5-methylcytosine-specific restriction endonuclease McrA
MNLNNPRAKNAYMTIDHIVPVSKGGTNNIGNLRGLCRRCNQSRQNDMNGVIYRLTEDFHYIGKMKEK